MRYKAIIGAILLLFPFSLGTENGILKSQLSDSFARNINSNNRDSKSVNKMSFENEDVNIKVIPTSLKIENDTLFFRYKLTTKTTEKILFYNLKSFQIKLQSYDTKKLFQYGYPRPFILLLDEENRLPANIVKRLGGELPKDDHIKYIILLPNDSQTFEGSIYLGCLNLKKGEYKIALEYLGTNNPELICRFKEEEKLNRELENSKLFQGILRSDTISFSLPYNITHHLFRHKNKE